MPAPQHSAVARPCPAKSALRRHARRAAAAVRLAVAASRDGARPAGPARGLAPTGGFLATGRSLRPEAGIRDRAVGRLLSRCQRVRADDCLATRRSQRSTRRARSDLPKRSRPDRGLRSACDGQDFTGVRRRRHASAMSPERSACAPPIGCVCIGTDGSPTTHQDLRFRPRAPMGFRARARSVVEQSSDGIVRRRQCGRCWNRTDPTALGETAAAAPLVAHGRPG